jgi:arginine/ornithine permease
VIGTGLFMGSGVTINQGGPVGAILAYLVAGFLMYLVMVCLGELSVQMPVSGSFQAHATKFIGPATGFMIGWVYWMSWATTVGLEFTAAGMLMTRWFPAVPIWYWSALFVVVLFGINAWPPAPSVRPNTGSRASRWRRFSVSSSSACW